jgi:putative acetyltransferase
VPDSLLVRGLRGDDWESLYTLLSLTEVVRHSLELPFTAEDTFRDRFSSPPANTRILIVETSLPSGRKQIVGTAWLRVMSRRRRHTGELSLLMHPDYAEAEVRLLEAALDLADNWLGLRRLEVVVYADAAAQIALYERLGFQIEATMRRYAFRDGGYNDACLLARVRGRGGDA